MRKRNDQIKRSFELENKGVTLLNPTIFDSEAELLRHCKLSKVQNYVNLYNELSNRSMRRLDKPTQVADIYIMARVYKYLLIKTGKEQNNAPLNNDYFKFLAMYQSRLDQQKQEDLESICFQIYSNKDKILQSEQLKDVQQQNGYSYS